MNSGSATRPAETSCAATQNVFSDWRRTGERRTGFDQHPGRRGSGRVLCQPRHVGDALRGGVGHGSAHARRAGVVRRRCHRRRRRLRAHGGPSGGGAAAFGSRAGQRSGQPAQCAARPGADGRCRRRPRHLSQKVRRPTGIRHRRARLHRLGMGTTDGCCHRRRRGRRRGDRRESNGLADLDADPARRCVLVRRGATRLHRARAADVCRPGAGARGAGGAAVGGADGAHGGWRRHPRARVGRRRADRRGNRGPVVVRDVPDVERLAYFAEAATAQLDGAKHLVLAGAKSPVSFFAYPGMPSDLVPAGCDVHVLAEYSGAADALAALADEIAPGKVAPVAAASRPSLPTGALTSASAADVIGALMPERAIVVDESNTSGLMLMQATAGAPAHDWLTLTGGAIGYGIPTAVGAAVAAPDRPVLCLESDGSAMYTISGLWTQARENLDVTTVIYNNGAYDILRIELQRVGAGSTPGPKARDLLDLSRPTMDFVKIAEGLGVPARRVTMAEELADALRAAFAEPGPHLIDAVVPSLTG